jgi:hypothetical protein
MAVPAQPTNLYLQTGQGNNYLSWDQTTTGATSFLIQRSLDNVTYSLVHTNTGSPLLNYWLDTTCTVGTQYFYQVAAQNGSGTSSYATPVLGNGIIPTSIGQSSLGYLRNLAQQRSELVNSQFIQLPEWNSYISASYKELYDLLIEEYAENYYGPSTYTWTTDGASVLYPLPQDFYKSLLCEVALNPADPTSWVTLRKFQRIQQNLWNAPNQYTFYGITNLRYRLDGNFLHLVPIASAGQTVRLWYAPRPNILMADTDTVDGVSGWEEYIVVDACIKALTKKESDTSTFQAQKMALISRIESAGANRDISEPETVSDSRTRNFSWNSEGDGGGFW